MPAVFLRRATRLLRDDWLRLHHLERFGGHVSVEGNRLYYHVVIGRKRRNIDDACLRDLN